MTFIQWSTCFLSNTLLLVKVPGSSLFWVNNYIDHLRGKKNYHFFNLIFFKLILKVPIRWRTYKLLFWQLIIKINVMSLWCHFGIRNKWHQLNIQKKTWIQNVVRYHHPIEVIFICNLHWLCIMGNSEFNLHTVNFKALNWINCTLYVICL